ncbi:MAG: hypothetical protein GF350_06640 [Chitinivibrionales bacterium]|nr:hypothetical protein [Chitinivibrionales bacterium]
MKSLIAVLFSLSTAWAVTLYVSPDGDDSNDGSESGPFKTLHHARDAIRSAGSDEKIVILNEGNYFLDEPLRFDENDNGTEQNPVVWKGEDNKDVAVYGGRRITGWEVYQQVEGKMPGVPHYPLSGTIYRAQLPDQNWKFWNLAENGKRSPQARHPNHRDPRPNGHGWGTLRHINADGTPASRTSNNFRYAEGWLPDNWEYSNARMIFGPGWFTDVRPISNVDYSARIITISPSTNPTASYWVEGAKEFIDQPGEWAISDDGYVYYWPKNTPIDQQVIVGGTMTRAIEFIGSSPSNPVKYITLENLLISTSNSTDEVYSSKTSPQSPADEDHENNCEIDEMRLGLVHFENAEYCTVRFCKIWNAGTQGVCMNYHAQHNTVYGCWIEGIGHHGVFLTSYCCSSGPWDNINSFNTVKNNYIHDYGKLMSGVAGVGLYQSGDNEITYNEIRRCARYGLSMKGQRSGVFGVTLTEDMLLCDRNVMQYNDISHVLHSTVDGGAYESWHPSQGNILKNNVFHDLYHITCAGRGGDTNEDPAGFCGLSQRHCMYPDAGPNPEIDDNAAYNCVDMVNWYVEGFGQPLPFTRSAAKRIASGRGFDIEEIGLLSDFPWHTPGQDKNEYEWPDEIIWDPDLIGYFESLFMNGDGLDAEYYSSSSLSGTPVETTVEPYPGFDWTSNKNVRLTGWVVPLFSEEYRFCADATGTVRIWIDDQQVLTESAPTYQKVHFGDFIQLQGGQPCAIKIESIGGSELSIDWYSRTQPIQVIPQSQLFSGNTAPDPVGAVNSTRSVTPPSLGVTVAGNLLSIAVPDNTGPVSITLIRPNGSAAHTTHGHGNDMYRIDASPYASGVYMMAVRAGNATMFRKVVLGK